MTPTTLLYLLITILIVLYVFNSFVSRLNAKQFDAPLPEILKDVYDNEAYRKSQAYKKENYKIGRLTGLLSLVVMVGFVLSNGFVFVDAIARKFSTNETIISLIFFAILFIALDIIQTPLSYYRTFVIEEKYGFNKTTKATFILDKFKSLILSIVLGGIILSAIIWFYHWAGSNFWIYAWLTILIFSAFLNLFYTKLIVPLFNKQTPLQEGNLKDEINEYATKVGYTIDKIVTLNGSKRSTKANAYFSGFGKTKQITLYDTLCNQLTTQEIVSVLAHEVGHYKKKHILYNFVLSSVNTGVMLALLGLCISYPLLSQSLGFSTPNFHIGLVAFSILYSPVSELIGIAMNALSRKFEYQADAYAKKTYQSDALISALKKLAATNFSNLTPHPLYIKIHYSHPSLLQRITQLMKK